MNKARGILSLVVASAVGVTTGIAIFNPAFKDLEKDKKQKQLFSESQNSKVENVGQTSTDSMSSTLATNAPRPMEDLDNVKSNG